MKILSPNIRLDTDGLKTAPAGQAGVSRLKQFIQGAIYGTNNCWKGI
jgi:hypothetical protein